MPRESLVCGTDLLEERSLCSYTPYALAATHTRTHTQTHTQRTLFERTTTVAPRVNTPQQAPATRHESARNSRRETQSPGSRQRNEIHPPPRASHLKVHRTVRQLRFPHQPGEQRRTHEGVHLSRELRGVHAKRDCQPTRNGVRLPCELVETMLDPWR